MKTKQQKTIIATAKSSPDPDLQLQIERRAYEIWEAGGARHGEDIKHWLQAETEVREQRRQIHAGQSRASA
jgi:Protein of unknown function (DUF2934)